MHALARRSRGGFVRPLGVLRVHASSSARLIECTPHRVHASSSARASPPPSRGVGASRLGMPHPECARQLAALLGRGCVAPHHMRECTPHRVHASSSARLIECARQPTALSGVGASRLGVPHPECARQLAALLGRGCVAPHHVRVAILRWLVTRPARVSLSAFYECTPHRVHAASECMPRRVRAPARRPLRGAGASRLSVPRRVRARACAPYRTARRASSRSCRGTCGDLRRVRRASVSPPSGARVDIIALSGRGLRRASSRARLATCGGSRRVRHASASPPSGCCAPLQCLLEARMAARLIASSSWYLRWLASDWHTHRPLRLRLLRT
ncbi:hypothetical protein OAO87_04685 [bacterium]|nr:hypothetical protein [bacterium]